MTNASLYRQLEVLQDRYGLKTASYLSAGAADLPHDISERLRAARVQAMAKRKMVKLETAGQVVRSGGSAALGWGSGSGFGWLARLGSALPLVALVVGMLVINSVQSDRRAAELAEVDAALLTDELPPAAFADPGFVQFLKTEH
jgi:hypothetical protein